VHCILGIARHFFTIDDINKLMTDVDRFIIGFDINRIQILARGLSNRC
jgi:hypothetical protein